MTEWSKDYWNHIYLALSPHSSETVLVIATYMSKLYDGDQMASSTFDSNQFKMDQREGWNSVAEGWKEWWSRLRKELKVSQRLIELAEIKSGQRILDVATGIGEPSMQEKKLSEPAVMF